MIKFIDYLKPEETYVVGEEMLRRGGDEMTGKEDLEYYQAHPDLLKNYKDKFLIFGGYSKLDSNDSRDVASLRWVGDRWILFWDWLGRGFYRDALLVRARKSSDAGKLSPNVLEILDSLELGIKNLREKLK